MGPTAWDSTGLVVTGVRTWDLNRYSFDEYHDQTLARLSVLLVRVAVALFHLKKK